MTALDVRSLTTEERNRFWQQVQTGPGCWLWTGATDRNGYGIFYARRSSHGAHRMALEFVTGPLGQLVTDHLCHVNGCVRVSHLRAVPQLENARNLRGAHSDSKSGVRGVSWDRSRRKWRADICVAGKRIGLGRFESMEEAEAAATAARLQYFGRAA